MCRPTYKEPLGNQIGHNGNNDYTRHHWILRKRCDGRCVSCQKKFEKNFFVGGTGGEKSHEYRAITCSWCKDSYHSTKEACFNYHDKLTEPCTLGEHKKLIVPPYWIIKTRRSTRPFRKRSKASESTTRPASLKKSFLVRPKGDYVEKTPLLVFINPKSGGNQGRKVMSELQYLLNPRQVFDLTQGGPNEALELYKSVPNLRILCCGGDGTCGWVMSAIDKIGFRRMPPVGVLPLGTGNDLSRSLDWGPGYTDTCLKKILNQIERANVEHMDRWHIETSDPVVELPLNVMNNYFSIGVDAKTSLKFHSEREANPEKFNSRFGNMVRYAHYGMAEFIKYKAETWKHVTLVCDGVDLTEKLHEIHAVSLIVLNIPSYSAGYMPWGTPSATSEFTDSRISDQKFEVIACSQQQFANVYIGKGTGERIAQAREIEIKIHTPLAVQIDGEATKIDPTTIRIRYNNQHKVLIRKKNDQEVRLPYHHKGECQQLKLIELRRSDSDEQLVDASAEQKMTEHELGMLSLPLDIDLETNRTRIEEHLRERVSDDLDDFYYVDGVTEDFEPLQKSRELTLLRDFLDEGETVLRIRRDIQNCQADSRDNRSLRISLIHPIFVLLIAASRLKSLLANVVSSLVISFHSHQHFHF